MAQPGPEEDELPLEIEIAPGLLLQELGEGRGELTSVAYGITLDTPRRPEDVKALELYCACVCDRLAALIERDPGFRTAEHRRDFWMAMQVWARFVLAGRAAAEDRAQARHEERALAATLARLRRDAQDLRAAVTRRSPITEVLRRNAIATRSLAEQLRTFSAAIEVVQRRRRRGRPATAATQTEALALLADIYRQATGKRPTVVTRLRPGGQGYGAGGASLAFAQAAITLLFPNPGSLVDDWRAAIKEMRAETRE
jgi:hypothetical protein